VQNEESQFEKKVPCNTNFKYNHTWQHESLIKLGFIKSRSSHVIFENSYKLHQISYFKQSMVAFGNIFQVESSCMEAPSTCTEHVKEFIVPMDSFPWSLVITFWPDMELVAYISCEHYFVLGFKFFVCSHHHLSSCRQQGLCYH
jgi:hypothetical protein